MPWYVWLIISVVGIVVVWQVGRKVFGFFGWTPSSGRARPASPGAQRGYGLDGRLRMDYPAHGLCQGVSGAGPRL